ncbi:tetratricopeptide repeat protein [Buchnera aphidicola (Periphyllus koelreuteriae)]|uniref:transglutaminase family protein n=1 Tax=Buchnera aphidicola TaxID=9 RepID=UPI0031B7FD96
MTILYDINFSKTTVLEVFFSIIEKIKKNFSKNLFLYDLKKKIIKAKKYINNKKTKKDKLKKFLKLFYIHWNFQEISGQYNLSDVLWLNKVLKTRKGTALSLGIILLYFFKKLEIPINPVIFPTQLILKFKLSYKKFLLINPFNGEFLNNNTLELLLKGNINSMAVMHSRYLKTSKSKLILKKILNTLKSALMQENKIELALKISNFLLQMNPKDPYEIRDRGLIYAYLECYSLAKKDLYYFINKCPDDPISDIIKLKINSIKNESVTLH